MSFENFPEDRYENALDDVIAQCDGDIRGALKALLAANEYLETELSNLHAAIESGEIPFQRDPSRRNLLN
ncbi:hypothetical protein [Bradyrhizobium sp. SYSU BS000235]|uniref:hypothetical protein n=1 Tax=Bradyrhizobium sp. SYSU BS000235 TaxID=3411332 RepID=UPI003C7509BB